MDTFNNNVFVWQQDRLSRLNFNVRVAIPTDDNIPVEITNSLKVEGAITI